MKFPNSNPFKSAYDQILTTAAELTDSVIANIIADHCGEDAEIKAIGRDGRRGWVRVSMYQYEIQDVTDCWIWITNDNVEWSMVAGY